MNYFVVIAYTVMQVFCLLDKLSFGVWREWPRVVNVTR